MFSITKMDWLDLSKFNVKATSSVTIMHQCGYIWYLMPVSFHSCIICIFMHSFHTYVFIKPLLERSLQLLLLQMSLQAGAYNCFLLQMSLQAVAHIHVRFYLKKSENIHANVQFSCSVMSDSLRPHEPQHARPPCPSPTPRVYSNSCPLSRWCHPTISSVVPLSSCPQSFPASGSFPMCQLFTSGGQSIRLSASTSVLLMNTYMPMNSD